ncbi:MAG: bacillithiol biosynthesis cysteine-adding enzyme BshC [Planctomycetes bacterium]|nr:bacillithiol biosynthesis cysteine-adding enzyme BshC [Planctomycetota bacterium]
MNLRPADLPPQLAPFPTELLSDPWVADRLGGAWNDPSALERAIDRFDRRSYARTELSRRLRADQSRWRADDSALDACDRLGDARSLCVVSGQQPGFLTGPLYSIYKIATTIALARRWTTQFDRLFIPVFWIASDDHDLAEMESCSTVTLDGALRRVRLSLGSAHTSVSRLPLPTEAAERITEFLAAAQLTDLSANLREALAPAPDDRPVDLFARIVTHLFRNTGLVLFEPRSFADLSWPFLRRHVEHPERMTSALRAGADALRARARAAPLRDDVPSCVFVAQHDRRRRFDPATSSLDVVDAIARTDPSAVTPDAALRPLMQSCLLPAPAFVGGPGELAYWLQLQRAFELDDVPQPLFIPRLSASLLEPKVRRAFESSGSDPVRALEPPPAQPATPAPEIDAAAKRILGAFDEFGRSLPPSTNVRRKLDDLRRAFSDSVTKLADLATREADQDAALARRRSELLTAHLRPGGQLQERVVNALPFAARYGEDLFARIAERIDPFDARHVFVDLVPSGVSGD